MHGHSMTCDSKRKRNVTIVAPVWDEAYSVLEALQVAGICSVR